MSSSTMEKPCCCGELSSRKRDLRRDIRGRRVMKDGVDEEELRLVALEQFFGGVDVRAESRVAARRRAARPAASGRPKRL